MYLGQQQRQRRRVCDCFAALWFWRRRAALLIFFSNSKKHFSLQAAQSDTSRGWWENTINIFKSFHSRLVATWTVEKYTFSVRDIGTLRELYPLLFFGSKRGFRVVFYKLRKIAIRIVEKIQYLTPSKFVLGHHSLGFSCFTTTRTLRRILSADGWQDFIAWWMSNRIPPLQRCGYIILFF